MGQGRFVANFRCDLDLGLAVTFEKPMTSKKFSCNLLLKVCRMDSRRSGDFKKIKFDLDLDLGVT